MDNAWLLISKYKKKTKKNISDVFNAWSNIFRILKRKSDAYIILMYHVSMCCTIFIFNIFTNNKIRKRKLIELKSVNNTSALNNFSSMYIFIIFIKFSKDLRNMLASMKHLFQESKFAT